MPLVTIRIARRAAPTTVEQKERLIAGVTDVVHAVLDKRGVRRTLRAYDPRRAGETGLES